MLRRNKTFLNDSHDEGGSVNWYVQTDKYVGTGYEFICGNCTLDAELKISDCSNIINLNFDCEKVEHIPKRIKKLETLINELQDMKSALEEVEKLINQKRKFYY